MGRRVRRGVRSMRLRDLLALLCFAVVCLIVGDFVIRGVLR